MSYIREGLLKELAENNIGLSVKIGSPMSALVSASPADREETEELVAKKVGRLIHFYKTTVFPAVRNAIMMIKEDVEKTQIETSLSRLSVKYMEIPEFVVELDKEPIPFKGFTHKAILSRNFSAVSLNYTYKEYLENITPERKSKVWSLISDLSNTKNTRVFEDEDSEPDYLFIAYALINSLGNDPVEGSIGNIQEYGKMIQEIKGFLDKRVNAVKESYYSGIDKKILIMRKFKDHLVLNSDVARMYFKENAIEPLLGVLLTKEYKSTMSWVVENKDRLTKVYEDARVQDNIIRKNKVNEIYKDAYLKNIRRIIDMVSIALNGKDVNDVYKEASAHVMKIKNELELMNIKKVVEDMLSEHIIPESGIGEFIRNIEIYSTQSPDLSIEEVVGLTAMDMVMDILVEGVVVQ